jgi:hypothetical protein
VNAGAHNALLCANDRLFAVLPLVRTAPAAKPLALLLTTMERVAPTLRRLALLGVAGLLIFSVTAAQLLSMAAARCTDASVQQQALQQECAGMFVDTAGVARLRAPLTPLLHFDDVPNAALSLFAIATLDDWPALVRPFSEADAAMLLLFATWIVLAALLWRNLVTAAIVDGYMRVSLVRLVAAAHERIALSHAGAPCMNATHALPRRWTVGKWVTRRHSPSPRTRRMRRRCLHLWRPLTCPSLALRHTSS